MVKKWVHLADDWTEREQKEMLEYLKKILGET